MTPYISDVADDQMTIAEEEDNVNYVFRRQVEEYEKWWCMQINIEKTQYMVTGEEGRDLQTKAI